MAYSLIGKWITIQCYKHDGTLHRYWDRGYVLEDNEDYLILATKRAKVVETNGRTWFTKEPAVTIFSKKEWWNAICMLKRDGICYYCNIASPSIIDRKCVKYIDYDLDTKLFPNGDMRILDEKEYSRHKETYHYSDELNIVLNYAMNEVIKKMKDRTFPFVDEKIYSLYEEFLQHTDKKKNDESL